MDRPARSESLNRLGYPGPLIMWITMINDEKVISLIGIVLKKLIFSFILRS
jgi:hypothetical protein